MEKKFTLSLLLDFYGKLLTEKQREIMTLYFNDDLSLSEIAADCGITRQAAHDIIRRTEGILEGYEQSLGLLERYQKLSQAGERLEQAAKALSVHVEQAGRPQFNALCGQIQGLRQLIEAE